jgi:N-acetylmuramoyl-L-alanine amidase
MKKFAGFVLICILISSQAINGSSQNPVLSVTPASLDFAHVAVSECSTNQSFTVKNTGGGTLTGTASTSAPFSIVSGSSFNLKAGQSSSVVVRFCPTTTGPANRDVRFTSNGGNTSRSVFGNGVSSDQMLLARVIYGEARGESYTGKIGVGYVVKNRVNDPRWPNTYSGVINQPGQFAIWRGDPSLLRGLDRNAWNDSIQAADQVIRGTVSDPTTGATHFYSIKVFGNNPRIVVTYPNGGETWIIGQTQTIRWRWANWPSGWGDATKFEFRAQIGNHRFYYELWTARGVRIELSRDAGTTWTTIISNTFNDESEPWLVTGPETTQARIRIVSLVDTTIWDGSDGSFKIRR